MDVDVAKFLLKLPDDTLDALRDLSQATGTPVTHYINRAVDQFLDGRQGCGVFVSGQIASGVVLVLRAG